MELARLGRALGERKVVGHEGDDMIGVVKSASRVMQILELFDVLKREALVSEVAELLDLPQSSTSVLLRSLVVMGYLSYSPGTRAFSPTMRVALLGNWINAPMLSDGPLIRLLHRLNVRTGQAVVLAVRNQVWSQYIHVVQAISPVRLFLVKGSQRPIVRCGTGLSLLADLPDQEIKRIGMRYNSEITTGEPQICLSELVTQIEAVRVNGFAFSHDTITPGGGSIAIRLPRLDSDEKFSIGIGGTTEILRANKDEYVAILKEEISYHILASAPNPAANG